MINPKIIYRKYSSGFEAKILLRPQFKQRFFGIIVDFGSADPQKVAGSAHFLEHKLFAKKDGDLSEQFEELGADVNAFTSFNETMFYASGVNHNQKIVELLFRLVGEPYFTKENVAKELPIIKQELSMYQDETNWAINNSLMQGMFSFSNLGLDVAGTQRSISAITPAELLRVYEDNYVASNMRFIACGDFSDYQVNKLLREVGRLQKECFSASSLKNKGVIAPVGKMMDITLPSNGESQLFGIGIRLENFKKVLSSRDLAQILLEIMLESKLSVTSPFFAQMRKQNLLNNPLQISVSYTREGNFATIFGVSPDSSMVINQIKQVINRPLNVDDQFVHRFFDLKKKEWLAQTIRSLNDLSYLAVETAEESLDNEDSFQNVQNLQLMSFEQFVKYCNSMMVGCRFCSARYGKGEE